jgi:hypothetical protein
MYNELKGHIKTEKADIIYLRAELREKERIEREERHMLKIAAQNKAAGAAGAACCEA